MDDEFISTMVGDIFEIKLDVTPTTGYEWKILPTSKSMEILKLLNEHREQKTSLDGVSSNHLFNFEALTPGCATIDFAYMRPWEKGKIRKQRTFRVQISG
jgi:predicted secreted protein